MKIIFDEIVWYAIGEKGHRHKVNKRRLKEYKNVTNVQNFLDVLPDENYYNERFNELIK